MPVVNGIIQAPVSIADVQSVVPVIIQGTVNGTVMRIRSGDLGVLCSAKVGDTFRAPITVNGTTYSNILWTVIDRVDINIWSKYKPVRLLNTINVLSQWDAANNKWKNNATWMHGSPLGNYAVNKYGLATHYYGTIDEVIAQYDANDPMNGWVYNRPQGGSLSPYRLTDFAGYCHDANGVAQRFICGAFRTNPDNPDDHNTRVTATFMYSPDVDYAITPENILGNGDYYFGVILVKGNSKFYFTGDNKSTAQAIISLDAGKYTAYPFFSNIEISPTEPHGNGIFYTIPMLTPTSFQLTSSNTGGITVSARYFVFRPILLDGGEGEPEVQKGRVIVEIRNTGTALRYVYFTLNYDNNTQHIRVPDSGNVTINSNEMVTRSVVSSEIEPYYGHVNGTLYWMENNGGLVHSFSFPIMMGVINAEAE